MELLKSVVVPYERLQQALDASAQGIIVFDNSRISFVNAAARDYLRLQDREVLGIPLLELSLLGRLGESVKRGVSYCRESPSPYREEILFGETCFRLKAVRAPDALCLVTLNRAGGDLFDFADTVPDDRGTAAPAAQDDGEHPLLTAVLLLAEVISREVPAGGEASYLCHQILRMLSNPAEGPEEYRRRCAGEIRLEAFEICRELVSLIRYSLPESVTLEADIPSSASKTEFRGSRLRCLLIQMALDSAVEIEHRGTLKLAARETESSILIELECRSHNGVLGKVDSRSFEDTKNLCRTLGGELLAWKDNNKRVRMLNLPTSKVGAKPGKTARTEPNELEGKGRTILLVDDEESIRSIGKAALERFGYTVHVACDGLEGLRVYTQRQKEIDLVLLDLVMPRLGGAVCFEKLKELNPSIKVVLMSGFTRNRRVNDLMAKGCLFFLRKPFELVDLINTVREAYIYIG